MKDKIIDYHPTKGYITFNDLITDIDLILQDYTKLEDIIINILEINNYDSETIASLFNDNIANRLDNIIYVLKDRLWNVKRDNFSFFTGKQANKSILTYMYGNLVAKRLKIVHFFAWNKFSYEKIFYHKSRKNPT